MIIKKIRFVVLLMIALFSTNSFSTLEEAENYLANYFDKETGVYKIIVLPGGLYEHISEDDILMQEDEVLINSDVIKMQANISKHASYEIKDYDLIKKKDYVTVKFKVFKFKKVIEDVKKEAKSKRMNKQEFSDLYMRTLVGATADSSNYTTKNFELVFEKTVRGYDLVYANYNKFLSFLKNGE